MMRRVNHQLRKNRRILFELRQLGRTKINKIELVALGFSFDYFTNQWKQGSIPVSVCYDTGLVQVSEHTYQILSADQNELHQVSNHWIIQRTG